jgi:hypothetical protein
MLGYVTLALQIFILIAVSLSTLFAFRTAHIVRETTQLIQSYRSQINWLEARMDVLEGQKK